MPSFLRLWCRRIKQSFAHTRVQVETRIVQLLREVWELPPDSDSELDLSEDPMLLLACVTDKPLSRMLLVLTELLRRKREANGPAGMVSYLNSLFSCLMLLNVRVQPNE